MSIAEKLQVIAENEQRVFDAGKKTEWDNFWDAYQDNGKRTGYYCGFSGKGWNDTTFKPKYNIVVGSSALEMFMYCEVTDIVKSLNECGVTLDFSNTDSCKSLFTYSKTKALPVLNFSRSTNAELFAMDCKQLVTIEKIISNENLFFGNSAFKNCNALTNITFEGVIGQNIDFRYSTNLSTESIISILNCLSTRVQADKTLTLSQAAIDKGNWDRIIFTGHGYIPEYGKIISSSPIELKAGERLKVELIVNDEHFFGTAEHDENDPNYWAVGLQWDNSANNREYTYTATADENHSVNVVVNRFSTMQDSPYVNFVVRAVKIDGNGNEISENLYNIVDDDFRHYTTFEDFAEMHPDWIIVLA